MAEMSFAMMRRTIKAARAEAKEARNTAYDRAAGLGLSDFDQLCGAVDKMADALDALTVRMGEIFNDG